MNPARRKELDELFAWEEREIARQERAFHRKVRALRVERELVTRRDDSRHRDTATGDRPSNN